MTLRSTKIRIKWLWPVKVTLEIIKRRLLVFCWSCDEIPLKKRRKKFPSLQFMNRDRMRLLLTLPRNGRSMPLKAPKCEIFECSDFHDSYTIKSLWGATLKLKWFLFFYLGVHLDHEIPYADAQSNFKEDLLLSLGKNYFFSWSFWDYLLVSIAIFNFCCCFR
jgi:hypothetical protein